MTDLTLHQLAEAVLRRHRPFGSDYVYADGTPAPSRKHCADSGFIVWPCIEYELAMAVLKTDLEPAQTTFWR